MWAIAWWFARRWMKRRAALAVAGVSGGVAATRGRVGAVLGSLALVGVVAAGLLFWRKRSGKADAVERPSPDDVRRPEPSPLPVKPPADPPPTPTAA